MIFKVAARGLTEPFKAYGFKGILSSRQSSREPWILSGILARPSGAPNTPSVLARVAYVKVQTSAMDSLYHWNKEAAHYHVNWEVGGNTTAFEI